MRIGFVGLGSQGAPMAQRIIDGGHDVALWARRRETLAPFTNAAARVANSLAELGANSDVVCVCVVGDADVVEVVDRPSGVLQTMAAGGSVVIHSTVHPDTCRALALRAGERGVDLIDAPVSGGGVAAAQRQLVVMIGGEPDPVSRCRPIFDAYSNCVHHLGPVGSGQLAKLLNNVLFTANLATVVSTLDLGEALGVTKPVLAELLSHSTARSQALHSIAAAGGTLDRLAAVAATLLHKDICLIADLAQQVGAAQGAVFNAADSALATMGQPR